MATVAAQLNPSLTDWLLKQQVFFVATAAPTGHVNVSPKGYDTISVISPTRIAYLDLIGSGIETVAHSQVDGRITLMFCSFDEAPRILRIYGKSTAHHRSTPEFEALRARFDSYRGARAIIDIEIERVSNSCGYAVPIAQDMQTREQLTQWADNRSDKDLDTYVAERNEVSIDGFAGMTAPATPDK